MQRLLASASAVFFGAVALLVLGFAGCSKSGGGAAAGAPRFAFVTNGPSEFWTLAAAGVAAAKAEVGCETLVRMPASGAVDEQKRLLEDVMALGVQGIAVSPCDPDNLTPLLDQLAKQTLLITHDSDAPKSQRRCFVGIDNYDAGRLAGKLLAEACPNGGPVVLFLGNLDQDNAKRRRQGLLDELAGRVRDPQRFDPAGSVLTVGKFEVRATFTDQFDRQKTKAQAQDAMTRWPDLVGMVGMFAYQPPILLDVLRSAQKLGAVQIVAFDEDAQTLQGIVDGHVHATVVQDPYEYGHQSILLLDRLHKAGDEPKRAALLPPNGVLDVPVRALRKADVPGFQQDLAKKLGKK